MTLYFEDRNIKLYLGNSLNVLRELPEKSAQCVVTSPPYFRVRSYNTAQWVGGDPTCDHVETRKGDLSSGLRNDGRKHKGLYEGEKATRIEVYRHTCAKCGAVRVDEQIGNEDTIEQYVENLVSIFGELWRVLRDDGCVWLNLGDSYNGSKKGYNGCGEWADRTGTKQGTNAGSLSILPTDIAQLRQKDMIGIPWRVAFALQGFAVMPFGTFSMWADELDLARDNADWQAVYAISSMLRNMDIVSRLSAHGWYLRSDVIWHKINVMPESTTDRPTKAHEYVFLLSKQKKYFYDNHAVKEPYTKPLDRWGGDNLLASGESLWDSGTGQERYRDRDMRPDKNGRNRRTVWDIPTSPYGGSHYATMSPFLAEICVKAGTSAVGQCPKCGAAWKRVVKRNLASGTMRDGEWEDDADAMGITGTDGRGGRLRVGLDRKTADEKSPGYELLGWRPTCNCNPEWRDLDCLALDKVQALLLSDDEFRPVPQIILDPFNGVATTGLAALEHGRAYVGIDLSEDYLDQSVRRLRKAIDERPLMNMEIY